MADSKTSALTAASTVGASDLLYLSQAGADRKVTIDQLPDGVRKVMASGSNVPVFDGEERSVVDRLTMAGTARLALAGTGRQIIESRVYVPGYIEATQRYPSDIIPIHQSGVLKRIQIATLQGSRTSFVAPNGSDSTGDGSMMKPWATIAKWVGTIGTDPQPQPGDTLMVRGGTYTAQPVAWIGRTDSGVTSWPLYGTAAQPIRIMAYPGERPVFTGGTDVLLSFARCTWVVLDGITIMHRPSTQSGYITTGQWPAGGPWGPADDITIQNCTFYMASGEGDSGYHPVYSTTGTHRLIVQYNTFVGPGNQVANDGGYGIQVYEGFRDAPHNNTVRYNVFDGWNVGGVAFFGGTESPNPDGEICHNTFKNCRVNIRLDHHEQAYVHDNFGEEAYGDISYNLLDDNGAKTTAFNNVWLAAGVKMGSFPAYNALSGSAAVGGASDGSIAGATQSSLAASQGWDTLGTQRKVTRNFVIPGDYAHDVIGRLEMYGPLRGAIQGTGELILSDDFKTRGRVVLAGRGG